MLKNKCACGCGKLVKYTYAHGHYARVHNPSKLPHVKEKRAEYLRQAHADGLRPGAWNKGLKGDPRCLEGAAKAQEYFRNNPEARLAANKKLSETIKRNGRVMPSGPDSYSWKGGKSDIVVMMRGCNAMFKLWKLPILIRDHFQCQHCGQNGSLQVHHDDIFFGEIIGMFLPADRHKMTFEEKCMIREEVIDFHVKYNVSGISLCKQCHKAEHKRIGLRKRKQDKTNPRTI